MIPGEHPVNTLRNRRIFGGEGGRVSGARRTAEVLAVAARPALIADLGALLRQASLHRRMSRPLEPDLEVVGGQVRAPSHAIRWPAGASAERPRSSAACRCPAPARTGARGGSPCSPPSRERVAGASPASGGLRAQGPEAAAGEALQPLPAGPMSYGYGADRGAGGWRAAHPWSTCAALLAGEDWQSSVCGCLAAVGSAVDASIAATSSRTSAGPTDGCGWI